VGRGIDDRRARRRWAGASALRRGVAPGCAALRGRTLSLHQIAIQPVDRTAEEAARRELDRKTKPRGSLGRLEELAARLAGIRGTAAPEPFEAAIVVAAADHGVAAEGVSAYPQEVTGQMLANFADGGAAISVLARAAGARLVVVDAGVVTPHAHPGVRNLRLGPGTANAVLGAAMSRELAAEAVRRGVELARELVSEGVTLVALGDMGIANTTSASALACVFLNREPAKLCGAGTGLDEAGIARKAAVVERMLERNRPDSADPLGVLAAVGGFEIGVLTGVALGSAEARAAVLLDGFITGAAALVAARLSPEVSGYFVAAHRSAERGHAAILDALDLEPLLDLGLRLGEGSGAALALPLVAAARSILVEMATFEGAGVSDSGR
jgi:nicotinate-nucleotide--dimethylbenzimidazole phosphoribosyltransferase